MKKKICVLFLITEILVFGCASNNQTAKPEVEVREENEEVELKIQGNQAAENTLTEAETPAEEKIKEEAKETKEVKEEKKEDTKKKKDKKADKKTEEKKEETVEEESKDEMTGLPNPFEKKASLDAANKAAGLTFSSPTKYTTYEAKEYRAIKNEMVEIIYKDSSNPDEDIRVRKAKGNLDISGDYNSYLTNKIVNDAGIQILLRGEDDRYHAATWTSGDYSFAIDSKAGITENKLKGFIQRIY